MQTMNPWLPRFAKLLVAATFCLIFLGGMVTSMNAGLSVPDWPTSYGYNMFTFPVYRWVGGIFFEHTHRLLASGVGLMTTVLVAWIWRNRYAVPVAVAVMAAATAGAILFVKHVPGLAGPEHQMDRGLIIMHVNIWSFAAAFACALVLTDRERRGGVEPWLRWLGFGAFLLVCVQGTLGGLRVTDQSIVLAMIHACTAQAFLCLTVLMAAALSPRWNAPGGPAAGAAPWVRGVAWALVGAVYGQLMIGAVMRHLHAGLAIPDFPLAFGRLIPPMLNGRVAIHFAHRVGAAVVAILIVLFAALVFGRARLHPALVRGAAGLLGLAALQIALGAEVLRSGRDPVITSLHVVNGAAVLALAFLTGLRSTRWAAQRRPASEGWRGARLREAHA